MGGSISEQLIDFPFDMLGLSCFANISNSLTCLVNFQPVEQEVSCVVIRKLVFTLCNFSLDCSIKR